MITIKSFYRTQAWEKKRATILRRDNYLCRECQKYGRRRAATVVHHIKERSDRPDLALTDSNLVSLCGACHNKLHPDKGGGHRRV